MRQCGTDVSDVYRSLGASTLSRTVHIVELGGQRKAFLDLPNDVTEAELLTLSANLTSMTVVMLHDEDLQ